MRITLNIGEPEATERTAEVRIDPSELATVHLHLAAPEVRNRSSAYMRRHPIPGEADVSPNQPLRDTAEPPRLTMAQHVEAMRRNGVIPARPMSPHVKGTTYGTEPAMLSVGVSDVIANPLRPCWSRSGLGASRLFFLAGEPIASAEYWCVCLFESPSGSSHLEMLWVRFDEASDLARDLSGNDLSARGLVWAAALVPLVVEGAPLAPAAIARKDYDLRQILGRDAESAIRYAYEGFTTGLWEARVEEAVATHLRNRRPFSVFLHSILAIDRQGRIVVRQVEGTLPGLAESLAAEGMVAAGLLDSGGSCAIYDVWLGQYLNHGWYFREPRGAILLFQLKAHERLPLDGPQTWAARNKE